MCVPILSRDQVAQLVVDRCFGFASPEAKALGGLLIAMDPESIREAEEAEAYLIRLVTHCEDPMEQFQRLTGRSLRDPA